MADRVGCRLFEDYVLCSDFIIERVLMIATKK